MKRYMIQRTVEAEKIPQHEAEERLGRELGTKYSEASGFLFCDMKDLSWDWLPEKDFHGIPIETEIERTTASLGQVRDMQAYFDKYCKRKRNLSNSERLQVYQVNRHLKALNLHLSKILDMNLLNIQL